MGSTWPNVVKAFNLIRKLEERPRSLVEIASIIDSSIRTVQRVLKMLKEELNIPIDYDQFGGETRYLINEDYSRKQKSEAPPIPVSPHEDLVLKHILRVPESFSGTKIATYYKLLLERLPNTETIEPAKPAAFSVSRSMYKLYQDSSQNLDQIFQAIDKGFALDLIYKSPKSPEPRKHFIYPLHVVEHRGGLYLFARFPEIKDEIRLLAIERIKSIKALPTQQFDHPKGFDPEVLLDKVFDITLNDPFTAVIWFAPTEVPYIQEREWSSKQSIQVHPDGSCTLTMETSGHEDVARWVLGFGGKAWVQEPIKLKEMVLSNHHAGVSQYSS